MTLLNEARGLQVTMSRAQIIDHTYGKVDELGDRVSEALDGIEAVHREQRAYSRALEEQLASTQKAAAGVTAVSTLLLGFGVLWGALSSGRAETAARRALRDVRRTREDLGALRTENGEAHEKTLQHIRAADGRVQKLAQGILAPTQGSC